ncbi:MAG: asparagine synthase B [Candidatus Marinimicrobia bacterium]|nr:asparagine synthase B [Candidatus Neomarinimicrobiota bacterium]RKY61497.1 MAG: asparagine synthase B [Candidatus Neomarinimicrobiota bacterium]
MCGIVAVINSTENLDLLRPRIISHAKLLRHRGPDWSGIHVQHFPEEGKTNVLAHERLAIVDPEGGAQPLSNEEGNLALAVNGEIYNHEILQTELKKPHKFATKSDCEIIVHLYEEKGPDCVPDLDGVFAFVLSDEKTGEFIAARDPIGVVPLFWGWGPDGSTWFASEMKALKDICQQFEPFPPGYVFANGELKRYYDPKWRHTDTVPTDSLDVNKLKKSFEDAVVKRMMCDVPFGVLLSGGLDSSLVSSIVSRHSEMRIEDHEKSRAWWPRIHSFCIGLEGAPDFENARKVAEFLGTVHHEYTYTLQEGLDALSDVIYHIETFDVTTVRASTPMYLMARKIKAMGIKMVFTGEGADEVFGGYLYFHKAPNSEEFYKETVRKVEKLHYYDCLRANKSMAAWGIEARVPFLDKAFLDIAMNLDPKYKMIDKANGRMEKYLMRSAFDNPEKPYLPKSILWRQKEQFSDGVGYGWIDGLKDYAESKVSDEMFKNRKYRFPVNTPESKEAYLYRMIFEEHFPEPASIQAVYAEPSIACSTAIALEWEKAWKDKADPSGRAVAAHRAAY